MILNMSSYPKNNNMSQKNHGTPLLPKFQCASKAVYKISSHSYLKSSTIFANYSLSRS